MGLFSPKPPVNIDEFDWLVACFAWLHSELGNLEASGGFSPVLVRSDTPSISEASNATELFDAIRSLAGMDGWECTLEQGEATRSSEGLVPYGEFSGSSAQGTFSIEGNMPVIRYDPALLRRPDDLAATFAHELAHLLIWSLGDPPGGHDLHEHATDCAAAYLGFGTFLANSARSFEQFQDAGSHGWRSSMSGYLSEGALVTATALLVRLFGQDSHLAREPLKSYLRKDFDKSLKYLDWRHPEFREALNEVNFSDWR
ncbi:MAG: hypothetical protein P8J20_02015 [Novosphingobium sp.]|nr:hypothetical protein [Novosphingobium sp.]